MLESAVAAVATKAGQAPPVAEVFLAIVLVMVLARLLGRVFRRIRQPAVVGEIFAGIVLGTSVLGQFDVGGKPLTEKLFPSDARPFLTVLANLGLVIFMFIVGLELDLLLIRGNERRAAVVSLTSVVVPLGLGVGLGLWFYDNHNVVNGATVDRTAFVLFIGASMSVTAFPVLARILSDRGMQHTPLGVIALACAAIDDVVAWTLLALVSAVAAQASTASSGLPPLWAVVLFATLYVVAMLTVGRRLLGGLTAQYERAGRLTPDVLAFLLAGLLLSSWITDKIGIHFIFGAFVFGACLPREGTQAMFHEILERLEQVSVLLLLPVFFIVTGLAVDLSSFRASTLGELALVLVVAITSKFGGAYLAARLQGLPQRRATALGLLLNTRGLTELVLLSVGQRLGVLDTQVFSMLVVMALITTVMTAPLLRAVYPERVLMREIAEAERAALGQADAYRVLVVVDEPAHGTALMTLALEVIGGRSPAEVLITRLRPQEGSDPLELGSNLLGRLPEIAAIMEEMYALEAQARARGVTAVAMSRFSDDPTREVREQVTAHDVDLVLVHERAADVQVDRLVKDLDATVVVWDGGDVTGAGPVGVGVKDRVDDAAVSLAVRLSRGRSDQLVLFGDDDGGRTGRRRLEQLVVRLNGAGVSAVTGPVPSGAAPAIAVRGSATDPAYGATALLTVVSRREAVDSELTGVLRDTSQPAALQT